jgi:TM2 domain-containing membrane protein YozV
MAFCTKCGQSNQQGSRFCNSCGTTMYGASAPSVSAPKQTVVSARRADSPTVLPRPQVIVVQGGIKSSGLAAVLSFFWCGLGHIYLGHFGTGLALMIGYPVMLWFGFGMALGGALSGAGGAAGLGSIFLLIALMMWIFGMVNAYRTADRMNQQDLPRY